jgi:hypothetical protein
MRVVVKARGFIEGSKELRDAAREYPDRVETELQKFGDEHVAWLKEKILSYGLDLAPKQRDNGEPPLVDSHKYVDGYKARAEGKRVTIVSEGMNDHMPNVELADVLEYGSGSEIPARPHLRPLGMQIEKDLPKLGMKITRSLLKGG